NGSAHNGTAHNVSAHNVTAHNGSARNGSSHAASANGAAAARHPNGTMIGVPVGPLPPVDDGVDLVWLDDLPSGSASGGRGR
ncbi:MAG: hypothetical protein AAGE88_25230, partial [Actinomycetota bacterium]